MYDSKLYYQRNKDRIRIVGKNWRMKNREKIREKHKEWVLKNYESYRSKMRISSKNWRIKNPDKVKANRYRTRDILRTEVLAAYGNKCKCCGETQKEFLSIDHINNDGTKQKKQNGIKSSQAMYSWLRKNKYPKNYFQILCHNCNLAKSFYGSCPHVR